MPPVLTHRDVRLDPSSYLLDPHMLLDPRAHQLKFDALPPRAPPPPPPPPCEGDP